MKKYCIFLLLTIAFFSFRTAQAQTAEDSVKQAVNKLFTAMKEADGASLLQCFTYSAILQGVDNKNGKVTVINESIKEFAEFVSKSSKGDINEQSEFDVIRIDDDLAVVWTPYRFYYKGKLMHCGADSFQFVRINGEWKIQYLVDTRRQDCNGTSSK